MLCLKHFTDSLRQILHSLVLCTLLLEETANHHLMVILPPLEVAKCLQTAADVAEVPIILKIEIVVV